MRPGYGRHDEGAVSGKQPSACARRLPSGSRHGTMPWQSASDSRMESAPVLDLIPLTLLTGFLGSGKTTLLRRALTDPAFSDTAVVINEIGEIAIDHYLVDFVEGEVLELPGGCLCCAVREDLAQTLRSLIERRERGEIRRFR